MERLQHARERGNNTYWTDANGREHRVNADDYSGDPIKDELLNIAFRDLERHRAAVEEQNRRAALCGGFGDIACYAFIIGLGAGSLALNSYDRVRETVEKAVNVGHETCAIGIGAVCESSDYFV